MSSLMAKGFSSIRDEQHSAELENLFQKTEFELKQLLKTIESEKEEIAGLKKQLELRPKEIKEEEAATRRCEEEVKRLHRQLTHNIAITESMKKQGFRLDEEIEKLQNKLQELVKTTAERAVEYNEKLRNYKAIWKSYEQKYTSSPKAQELQKLQQNVDGLTEKRSELVQKRETLERKLLNLTISSSEKGSQNPRWTDWFVKLASVKMETIKLQNETAEMHQAKLKALEENKFLEQKLASLKAEQQSSQQVDEVIVYEAPQEQHEEPSANEPADGVAEVIPEDTTFIDPTPDQMPIELQSSENDQQPEQIPQFAFTDTNTDNDPIITTFVTTGNDEPMLLPQGGFNFSGFGEDTNIPQQGISAGLQLTSGSNANTIFGNFSFTSPSAGRGGEEGATGMSCFGSPASVASGGQENFFLFSGSRTPTTSNSSNVFNLFQ